MLFRGLVEKAHHSSGNRLSYDAVGISHASVFKFGNLVLDTCSFRRGSRGHDLDGNILARHRFIGAVHRVQNGIASVLWRHLFAELQGLKGFFDCFESLTEQNQLVIRFDWVVKAFKSPEDFLGISSEELFFSEKRGQPTTVDLVRYKAVDRLLCVVLRASTAGTQTSLGTFSKHRDRRLRSKRRPRIQASLPGFLTPIFVPLNAKCSSLLVTEILGSRDLLLLRL